MAKKENKEKKKNNFVKELKSELKKVSWPTFKKLVNNTSVVIFIVLIVAAIVFVLDVCFENLNKFGVEKLKSLVSTDSSNMQNLEQNSEEGNDFGEGIVLDANTSTEVQQENIDSQQVEPQTEQNNTEATN